MTAGPEGVQDGRDVGRMGVDADLAAAGRPAGAGEIGADDMVRGRQRVRLHLVDVGCPPDAVQERHRGSGAGALDGEVPAVDVHLRLSFLVKAGFSVSDRAYVVPSGAGAGARSPPRTASAIAAAACGSIGACRTKSR